MAFGQPVSQWFDLYELPSPAAISSGTKIKEDAAGYWKTVEWVKSLVAEEETKWGKGNVIVGGFSQGAAVSLGVAASGAQVPVLCLSGFAVKEGLSERIAKLSEENKDVSIFHGHGDADDVVDVRFARATAQLYKDAGFSQYAFKEYPNMGHSSNEQELADISNFISTNLSR